MSLQLDNLARNMTDELDKAVAAKPVTGFFADNPLRSKFVGAKTVLIPEMEVSGLGDYDRDNGFVKGTIAVSAQPHVLAMDRGRSFQLDREDNDETGHRRPGRSGDGGVRAHPGGARNGCLHPLQAGRPRREQIPDRHRYPRLPGL